MTQEGIQKLESISFGFSEAKDLLWADKPENKLFFTHIINVCNDFPSVFLGFSASAGALQKSQETAEALADRGINVFTSPDAVPLCAFSHAITMRSAPLGLYLTADEKQGKLAITALSSHGGYFDAKSINNDKPVLKKTKKGVIGQTDMLNSYIKNIIQLSDQNIEKGPSFASLDNPFPALEKLIFQLKKPLVLTERSVSGYKAEINNDGQKLTIYDKDNLPIPTEKIATIILSYLQKERYATGITIGPTPLEGQSYDAESFFPAETSDQMSYFAGYANLLMGWSTDGIIAHQGSSCFGDALLTAVYFIEAIRSN